jgi:mutator protein MutT
VRRNQGTQTKAVARHSSKPIEVAAGLVFREGKLLITQRRAQDHLGGLWEFPGGKCKRGETYAACLRRELEEELGISVEVGEVVASITHEYPEKTVHLEFFRCAWRRHEPRALGCADFVWVERDDLKNYEFPAADRKLLAKLRRTAAWWR